MKQRQGGLNIRVELSNGHLIDLEMQIANEHNWPERSISYAARSFDNLNAGDDYVNVMPVHSIGFLDFTLFPEAPEFYSTYQLQNVKEARKQEQVEKNLLLCPCMV